MSRDLLQSVARFLHSQALVRAGERVAVAVSGGADSVALLRVLLALRGELGLVLSVAHFDHQIRGEESAADAEFVRSLAQTHNLEFHFASGDAPAFAKRHGLSLETAARQLRYDFFLALLDSGEANKIATGHTLDDQAETVLMRMLRGAGTRGLAAILPALALPGHPQAVVRPLLQTRRAEIEDYLRGIAQSWREDSSNRSPHHTRNRIRHELVPLLHSFNPQAASALAEGAEIARAEEEYWQALIAGLLPKILNSAGDALSTRALLAHPLALQRRLLIAAAELAGLTLDFAHVEELLALIKSQPGLKPKMHPLPGGHAIFGRSEDAHSGELQLRRGAPPSPKQTGYLYMLQVPGEVSIAETGTIIRAAISRPAPDSSKSAAVHGALEIRNWRAGDRFRPAHTRTAKKIKELLQSVPAAERTLWPVVAQGPAVIWMRGFNAHAPLLWRSPSGESCWLLIEEVTSGVRAAAKAQLQGTIAHKETS